MTESQRRKKVMASELRKETKAAQAKHQEKAKPLLCGSPIIYSPWHLGA